MAMRETYTRPWVTKSLLNLVDDATKTCVEKFTAYGNEEQYDRLKKLASAGKNLKSIRGISGYIGFEQEDYDTTLEVLNDKIEELESYIDSGLVMDDLSPHELKVKLSMYQDLKKYFIWPEDKDERI